MRYYHYFEGDFNYYIAVDAAGKIQFRAGANARDLHFLFEADPDENLSDLGVGPKEISRSHFFERAGIFFSTVTGLIQSHKPNANG